MANFKAFALLSSIFLTFVQLGNAVPLQSLFEEFNSVEDFSGLADTGVCKDDRDDCNHIVKIHDNDRKKIDDYCRRYENDAAVKMCRETCNMCKPPAPTVCEDERTDCDIIVNMTGGGNALKDYCNRHKGEISVQQCRKTCNFCKPPSPPVCKDDRSDCDRIAKMHDNDRKKIDEYCKRYENDAAVKMCRKTCNMCPKTPSPTNEPETVPPKTEKPTQKTAAPTTTPKPTQSSGWTPTDFEKACLEEHNLYRDFHGSPHLKLTAKLTRDAQLWANVLAATGKFHHDPSLSFKDQGENLYFESPAKRLCDRGESGPDCLSCGEIVQPWYDEETDYDYATGKAKTDHLVIGHFTQIVWRATREMGMATAVAHNRLVAVARYSPAGNNGNFRENVLPPDFP